MKNRDEETKVRNFYYLLAYAFDCDKLAIHEEKLLDTEKLKNISDFLAIILYIYMKELLKEGLYGEYINYSEELNYVKGKINIIDTVNTNILKLKNKVICNYDDYSINNILNQILKTTLFCLLKTDICKVTKVELRQIYYNLENIQIIKNWKNIKWDNIKYTRLNMKYKPIINICKFILNDLILNTKNQKEEFQTIDDEQVYHQLFEKFIRNYLIKYYKVYRKKKIQNIYLSSEKIEWQVEDKNINNKIPKMHTDITIKYENKEKIIDTKFYGHIIKNVGYKGYQNKDKGILNSNNWYQIFSYIMNKQEKLYKENLIMPKKVTSGMLLYAKTEEDNLNEFEVNTKVMGHGIQVKIIDFTQEFGDPYSNNKKDTIAYNINEIAEEIYNELL